MLLEAAGGEGTAEGFLDLAPALHGDDSGWIPEDREGLAACFGPSSPWLRRGRAHTFCVADHARVSVYRPHGMEIDGMPAAFFGHFESSGHRRAEALVLAAARAWARDAGAARLYGPVDLSPSRGHCLRLDVDPRSRRYLDEPYNPARYTVALRALGFRESRRYAGVAGSHADLRRLVAAGDPSARALLGRGYRFEPLTPAAWHEWRAELRELANVVFAGNFGFSPLSREEFDATFDSRWARRLDPDLSILAIAPDGRLAGFGPHMPDYVPLLVQGAGDARLTLDDVSYDDHAAALARLGDPAAVARAGGIAPEHQRLGLAVAMTSWVARRALKKETPIFYGRVYTSNPALRLLRGVTTTRRSYAVFMADVERGGR